MTTRIAVLGGGVAGCIAARRLAESTLVDVDLIERDTRLGGLHRSICIDDAVFDIGAFVFSGDHLLFSAFPGLKNLFPQVTHDPRVITPHGTIDRFPLTPRGYLRDNGVLHVLGAGIDLMSSKLRWRRRDSLAAYLRYYLGDTMYRASGLKDYIARFYMIDETQIDLEFAMQRLASIADAASLRRTVRRLVSRSNTAARETAWTCHVRPAEGFDAAYGFVAQQLRACGVDVQTGANIESLRRVDGGYRLRIDGVDRFYDRVISTIPIGALVKYLSIESSSTLEHMSLLSLFFRSRGDVGDAGHYFYNFTPRAGWKRAVIFSRYYGTLGGDHYFTVECTRRTATEDDLAPAASDVAAHLRSLRLVSGELTFVGGCVTPGAYPVLERGYKHRLEALSASVSALGIESVGRQGAFRYEGSQQVAVAAHARATRLADELPVEAKQHV